MHVEEGRVAGAQVDVVEGIRPQGLDAFLKGVEGLPQLGLSRTQAESFHEEDGRAGNAEEDADGRKAQGPALRDLRDFLQDLAGPVYYFLDVFIVNRVDVHWTHFVDEVIRVRACEGALNDGLHADRVGVDAYKVVFDEDRVEEGLVEHCGC